jgi:hypothetical protein
MSPLFSSSQSHRQKRLRSRQLRRWLLWFLAIGVVLLSYQLGKMHASAVNTTDTHMIQDLSAAKADLEKQVVTLKADLLTTQTKLDELTQQYDTDVGDKDLLALNRIIHDRLDSGVTMERLQQVIAATSNVRNCSSPDTKRFMVTTDTSKGPVSKVNFGSGLIVITGTGEDETNSKGGHETWYDPKQPVHVTITVRGGGEPIHKDGVLPIHQSVIHGDTEYLLTIAPGGRSYAEVTSEQCAYP